MKRLNVVKQVECVIQTFYNGWFDYILFTPDKEKEAKKQLKQLRAKNVIEDENIIFRLIKRTIRVIA